MSRLLFVSNLYPPITLGGYEQICHDTAVELQARGHDVTVLTSNLRAADAGQEDGVVRRLGIKSWAPLGQEPRATQGSDTAVGIRNARELSAAVGRVRPETIVFWNGGYLGRALLSAAAGTGLPVVYYLSDPWLVSQLGRRFTSTRVGAITTVSRAALRLSGVPACTPRAENLVFCSRALRVMYEREGLAGRHTAVIHHGLPAETFAPARAGRGSGRGGSIVYVGRIARSKGVMTLIYAFAQLRQKRGPEGLALVCVGPYEDPEWFGELRRLVVNLGLQAAVSFEPARPRSQVPGLFASHDIVILPSEWEEPFSLVLLEAMASGIPVVSTTTGGSAEIVRDRENAVAFRAGDPTDMAEAIGWVLDNPSAAAEMARRASEEVGRDFTLAKQVDQFEVYLETVLAGGPS